MKQSLLCGLALAIVLTGSANADIGAKRFGAALAAIPVDAVQWNKVEIARYLDTAAVPESEITAGKISPDTALRIRPSSLMRPVDALTRTGTFRDWNANTGQNWQKFDFFAGYGTRPYDVTVWGGNEADMAPLLASFDERGFETEQTGRLRLYRNGEAGSTDITKRNPASPWRGMLGRASILTLVPGLGFAQSFHQEPLEPIADLATSGSLADAVFVQRLVEALDSDGQRVMQAHLYSKLIGIKPGDPALALLKGDSAELPKLEDIKALQPEAAHALPVYDLAALVGLGEGIRQVGLALVYESCDDAATAAKTIKSRLQDDDIAQGKAVSIDTLTAEDGGCVALATLDASEHPGLYGKLYMHISNAGSTLLAFSD
jgi:hypothetical protein